MTVDPVTAAGTAALADLSPPRLDFRVETVAAAAHAAVPTLVFGVRIDAGGRAIRSLSLNAQIRIDATRRRYSDEERERLYELYGPPADWGRTLRSLLWTHVAATVPPFDGETTLELAVPCTYDFEVAVASKYLHALGEESEVPLELLFSGTIFFTGADGRLQVAHVPWDREARCVMPVRVWREAIDAVFPNAAWLRLSRDTFERLQARKSAGALLTWDAVLEELLDA